MRGRLACAGNAGNDAPKTPTSADLGRDARQRAAALDRAVSPRSESFPAVAQPALVSAPADARYRQHKRGHSPRTGLLARSDTAGDGQHDGRNAVCRARLRNVVVESWHILSPHRAVAILARR